MTRMSSLGEGYRAAVIGASGAIGGAVADALAADPRAGAVVRIGRSGGDLRLDLSDEESIVAAAGDATADGPLDLVFIATGGLTLEGRGPEKALSQLAPEALARQFAVNAIGPALVVKHFAPRLAPRRRALMAALSARVGSIGDNRLGGWHGYRAAKAALNQLIKGAAIEIARRRPEAVLAALHPGTVESPLSTPFRPQGAQGDGVFSPQEAAGKLLTVLDILTPEQSGGFFDYSGVAIPW